MFIFNKKRRMYPYRIFFKRVCPPDDIALRNPWELNSIVSIDKIYFFTPLIKGEKALFPQHLKKLWDLPEWILKQGTWQVEEIIHQTEASLDECDTAILAAILDDPVSVLIEQRFEEKS